MDTYSIDNFWKTRLNLGTPVTKPNSSIEGWEFIGPEEAPRAFKEAPLTLSTTLTEDSTPQQAPILLVSAPGAVGKSTLAKQIAHITGAVYLNLAIAGPIASDSFTGGLVNSGLYPGWQAGTTAILVDGLDEARLRVYPESFAAFLADVTKRSYDRSLPTVLFGRTGAVEDAWLVMQDFNIDISVLEIGYYDPNDAVEFAISKLVAEKPGSPHIQVQRQAIELLLENLRGQTSSDGDRFAGYAPVLMAVARRVAEDDNPGALVARIRQRLESVTLQSIIFGILNREAEKLRDLPFEDSNLFTRLYRPEEQLDRVVAHLYGTSLNLPEVVMTNQDREKYENALKTWVPDHPFVGGGEHTRSIVFDAAISAHALKTPPASENALQKELARGAAANPFLSELYAGLHSHQFSEFATTDLNPEHIGALYASFRARLSLGDSANLLVEGDEKKAGDHTPHLDVEVTISRSGQEYRTYSFKAMQPGTVRMGTHIEDAEIDVPQGQLEIGPGEQAVLSAPVAINCGRLEINARKIIFDNPSRIQTAFISLQTDEYRSASMNSLPILRNDIAVGVSWPNSKTYPWNSHPLEIESHDDPHIDEGLRRLRKFVITFQAKGSSQLARFRQKIESARMTKGSGLAILDAMKRHGIILAQGNMYILNTNALGNQVRMTYIDWQKFNFGPAAVEFVRQALQDSTVR